MLVGGLGTRLREAVPDLPKPLAPVAGRPFVAWLLDQFADAGLRRVILATGHRAQAVRDAIGTRWAGLEPWRAPQHRVRPGDCPPASSASAT